MLENQPKAYGPGFGIPGGGGDLVDRNYLYYKIFFHLFK